MYSTEAAISRLCAACQGILHAENALVLNQPPLGRYAARAPFKEGVYDGKDHHMTESDMKAAAQDGCRICTHLWADWLKIRDEEPDYYNTNRRQEDEFAFSATSIEGNLDEGYKVDFTIRFDRQKMDQSIARDTFVLEPVKGPSFIYLSTSINACLLGYQK